MISALRKLLLPALPSEPLRWVQAEDLWHEARILIADLAERAQAQHRLHTERLAHALTVSGAALLATQQVAALTGAVRQAAPASRHPGRLDDAHRPRLGVGAAPPPRWRWCWRTTWSGRRAAASRRRARSSAAAALLPAVIEPLGRRASIIVEPLYFHDRTLGCLLMEMGPREGIVYESLAEQVSSALEGARLVARLVEEATRRQVGRARAPRKGDGDRHPDPDLDPAARRDRPGAGDRRHHADRDRGRRRLLRRHPGRRRLLDGDRRRRRPRPRHRPRHADDAERDRRALRASCPTPHPASSCWRSTRCWSTTCGCGSASASTPR